MAGHARVARAPNQSPLSSIIHCTSLSPTCTCNFMLNPLSPNSAQDQFSPNNILRLS